ncbi:glycoside hydrolase family 32 protein [Pelagovum pacificum]|uniref:Glycoside hydrolase family 32 protein n=1 Tax=Pelagovum pacificum TaxID=2588711 RepID=A0A5C5GDW4_9RHOB|nr:glycoside hydrolase family 32 protein [Pelagovum pacificum]QQA41411.1 glycoside hydrolase family 32 protein [Pelagovum pacificum]TNY31786.1 glycoside hydrolase family 32 protein [Pelagovum pacificum]
MTEKFRPRLHFTPSVGWMNDPNGMIRSAGYWHLFFQYDPDSITHGPMHWGHARSRDLTTWEELPVALYPDDLGTCFSGSAVETPEGEVKLFYTSHRLDGEGRDFQQQCLVHADLGAGTFDKDPGNPVIPNPGLVAFRDPKVIRIDAGWVMLVTEGQTVGFYGSDDLRTWRHLSSFGEGEGRHSDEPWECPDLVPLTAPDGSEVWMLIIGVNPGAYAEGSGTQYFLGQFDGLRFENLNPPETELWLDHGRDYYAAQTFFERDPSGPPVAIGWASNWRYAKQTPTEAFRGVMSLPRALQLVETQDGLRVAASLPDEVRKAVIGSDDPAVQLAETTIELGERQVLSVTLFGEAEPQFMIERPAPDRVRVRTLRPEDPTLPTFGHDYDVTSPWSGPLPVMVLMDHGLVELCAGDGRLWLTNLFYPDAPEASARFDVWG